ncbi:hypothetical protein R6Q59_007821 [Mikania micrantha]
MSAKLIRDVGIPDKAYPDCDLSMISVSRGIGSRDGHVITSLAIILGSGSQNAHLFATDMNPHATKKQNHNRWLTDQLVMVMVMDLELTEERLSGMVDLLVINPTYVPTNEDEVGGSGLSSVGPEVKMTKV